MIKCYVPHSMLNRLSCLLAFLFLLVSATNAQLSRSVKFQKNELELKSEKAEDKGEEFQRLKMKDLYNVGEPGQPELPVKYVKLIVPSDMDISDISITASGKESVQLPKKLYPAQYPIPTSINHTHRVAKADSVIYNSDSPFPSELVKVVDQGYFDGNHIVTLAVYPIQYFPKIKLITHSHFQAILMPEDRFPKLFMLKTAIRDSLLQGRRTCSFRDCHSRQRVNIVLVQMKNDFYEKNSCENMVNKKITVKMI